MDKEQMMPVRDNQATIWTVSADRKTVRLSVPPLRLAGMPEPLAVYMDFDVVTIDAMQRHRPAARHGAAKDPDAAIAGPVTANADRHKKGARRRPSPVDIFGLSPSRTGTCRP